MWFPGANTPVDHSATPPALSVCNEVVTAAPILSVKATAPVAVAGWLGNVAFLPTGCASRKISAPYGTVMPSERG